MEHHITPKLTNLAKARKEVYKWYMDSCCGQHMVSSSIFILNSEELFNEVEITIINSLTIYARSRGQIQLESYDTGYCIHISDVLVVPELQYKLLSLDQLMKCGVVLQTTENELHLIHDGNFIGKATSEGGVFVLDFESPKTSGDNQHIIVLDPPGHPSPPTWSHPKETDYNGRALMEPSVLLPFLSPRPRTLRTQERKRWKKENKSYLKRQPRQRKRQPLKSENFRGQFGLAFSNLLAGTPPRAGTPWTSAESWRIPRWEKPMQLKLDGETSPKDLQQRKQKQEKNQKDYLRIETRGVAIGDTDFEEGEITQPEDRRPRVSPPPPEGPVELPMKINTSTIGDSSGTYHGATLQAVAVQVTMHDEPAEQIGNETTETILAREKELYAGTKGYRADLDIWHQRFGHPSIEVLNNCINANPVSRPSCSLRAATCSPLAAPCGPLAASSTALAPPGCCLPCYLRCPAAASPAACAARLLPTLLCTALLAALAVRCPALPCVLPSCSSAALPAFDHEGRPIQFDKWLDDLQLYLLSDSRDSVSLFDNTSGASLAPPATADSATRSQWLTRDAAACLSVRNHLPLAKRAHFGQHKTAKALYDAVVARYSSPATAALGRLLLPYFFPELSAFATVLLVALLTFPSFRGVPPPAAVVDVLGAEDVRAASAIGGKRRSSKGKGGRSGGGGSGGGGGGGGSGGGVGSKGGGSGGSGGGSGGFGGGSGGGSGGGGRGGGGSGGNWGGAVQRGGSGGGQRQQQSGVAIFDLDYDAILAAMYALSVSAEGDCYLCVPPDPGIDAAALGASESALPGTAPTKALHTFTLDSGASRCFFRDSTTLTPLSAPVPVRLADPSGGPVLARSSTVLSCPAVPSGSLSGLHLLSFSTNLVSTAALQDVMVTTTTLGAASAQVSASSPVAPPCSCRLLSHQTLLWHHRLGQPSQPSLRGMHSRLLVSGLPRSLPPLPPSSTPPCLPCAEGRQRAAPHSSLFPPRTAPLLTLHMDVWGPARVTGQGRERYFLLSVSSSASGSARTFLSYVCTLREVVHSPPTSCGTFVVGRASSFTLPASLQQNGIAERRIGLIMEVALTSMIHAAAPHFLWPFAVRYVAHQLSLWPRVSLPETSPTLCWTGKVGYASVFRVWGSRAFVRDTSADKLSARAIPCVFLGFVPDAPGWQFYHPTFPLPSLLPPSPCFLPVATFRTGAGGAGAGGAGAGDPGAGDAGAGGTGTGGAGAGGTGAVDPRYGGAGAGGTGAGGTGAGGTLQRLLSPPPHRSQPELPPDSPLPAPSPYAEQTDSFTERCEPESCLASPVRAVRNGRVLRPRPPSVPGTHVMALRPSSVPLRVPLPPPPASSLPAVPDPESDFAHAASHTVPRILATVVTYPCFESTAASALISELVDFDATCHLDYATALVAESESACPPSVGGRRLLRAIKACSSQWKTATVSLGRLFLPFLFPDLASFERTADLIAHLRSLDSSYRAAYTDAQLALLPFPMAITIYFIATSLPDRLASIRGGGDVASGGGGSAGARGAPRVAAGDSPAAAGGGDARVGQHQLQRRVVHPPCTYHVLTGARRSQPCGCSHPPGQCIAQLTDTVRLAYGIDGPAPDWLPLVQTYGPTLWGMSASQLVDLLGTPHAMHAVVDSSASDFVFSCVVSLGASLAEVPVASVGTCVDTSPGAAPEDASLSFTLDSRASHCFFHDRTTLTPLPTPVSVALADPTSGPVTARYTTTLLCTAVPSGSPTGFYVPSFSRNLVGVRPLMSQHVGVL
ncbi:unnamed protein product [Closterium sp. NIES-54]